MGFLRNAAFALLLALCAPGPASGQTVEDMAGQMVMVGFQGASVSDPGVQAVRRQIAAGEVGGVMYLRPNIESLAQVKAMNMAFRSARPWSPPLIAIDQEGGQIRRLTVEVGFDEIPSAWAIGRGRVDAAREIYGDLAERLAALGFNVNFGPVADLALNPDNPIIVRYDRSFGTNPVRVAQMAGAFIEGHRAAGVGTALKHFPGHGSSEGDTHEGFVDVTGVWEEIELEPYRRLIGAGLADMVMVAHIFNGRVDGGGDIELPASLSPQWIEGVLRTDLGFEGVVISDDMEMSAVRAHFDLRETVVRAVMAGNDIILFSNSAAYDPQLGTDIYTILVEEARADPRFAARIKESYRRIAAYKAGLNG
ncbi:glycoside hydrolase family 3 protein [Pelagibacterium sediminicola]|uniref:glycoside hydrolase family 3 protein n=1 Tax=Pelagibacterium sediminicola TaxID=2248761 RepID=UPI000E31B8C5|nr:glycoside hydrolase family 3 N-terminal domain-containing protein [Pelagibacterium sediminicola]